MSERIEELERNQKSKNSYNFKGVIYVFEASKKGLINFYKLGRAKYFRKRMSTHTSSWADDIKIICTYETNNLKGVEGCIKSYLKSYGYQYRKQKEIYKVDIKIIKTMIEKCLEANESIKQFITNKRSISSFVDDSQDKFAYIYIDEYEEDNEDDEIYNLDTIDDNYQNGGSIYNKYEYKCEKYFKKLLYLHLDKYMESYDDSLIYRDDDYFKNLSYENII